MEAVSHQSSPPNPNPSATPGAEPQKLTIEKFADGPIA